MKHSPPVCCLCNHINRQDRNRYHAPYADSLVQWDLRKPTRRIITAHELCVVELLEQTLRTAGGQQELFSVAAGSEVAS